MKIECFVENLTKTLPLVGKILPNYAQAPILSNIMLEATSEGFFISATDLELGVRIKIPAKIEKTGSTTIPGKYFIEAVSILAKTKVKISLEKDIVTLDCSGSRIQFNTIPKDEFPAMFDQKGEKLYSFDQKKFRDIFSSLVYAVSTDEARPQLTGVLIAQGAHGVDFVATDGYRLSVKKTKEKIFAEGTARIILSARLIQEAFLLKSEGKPIDMYLLKEANQVLFETSEAILVGRTIQGEFPSYERVIPVSSKTTITLDKEELAQALRLTSVFAKEASHIVKLSVKNNTLTIHARSQGVGEGEATLDVEKKGEDNEISFNARFLLDLIKNSNGKNIIMEINSHLEPGLFKVEGDDTFLYVIMPVRVQEA